MTQISRYRIYDAIENKNMTVLRSLQLEFVPVVHKLQRLRNAAIQIKMYLLVVIATDGTGWDYKCYIYCQVTGDMLYHCQVTADMLYLLSGYCRHVKQSNYALSAPGDPVRCGWWRPTSEASKMERNWLGLNGRYWYFGRAPNFRIFIFKFWSPLCRVACGHLNI